MLTKSEISQAKKVAERLLDIINDNYTEIVDDFCTVKTLNKMHNFDCVEAWEDFANDFEMAVMKDLASQLMNEPL